LPEGVYEALIQMAPNGRIIARAEGSVAKGATTLISLQAPDAQTQGHVTSTGIPPRDLRLAFRPSVLGWAGNEATINKDDWYDVWVYAQVGNYCAWLSSQRAANHLHKCGTFFPGLQRLDLNIAPGVIQVSVPAFDVPGAEWAHITARALKQSDSTSETLLVASGGSASYKSKNGFRGDFIGLAYGQYVVYLTVGDEAVGNESAALISTSVTLSSEEEVAVVPLRLPPSSIKDSKLP